MDRGELVSNPVGQGEDDLSFDSVMAHLFDLVNFPGLRAAARGGTFRPQVCRRVPMTTF
jgi:hypothetical protein